MPRSCPRAHARTRTSTGRATAQRARCPEGTRAAGGVTTCHNGGGCVPLLVTVPRSGSSADHHARARVCSSRVGRPTITRKRRDISGHRLARGVTARAIYDRFSLRWHLVVRPPRVGDRLRPRRVGRERPAPPLRGEGREKREEGSEERAARSVMAFHVRVSPLTTMSIRFSFMRFDSNPYREHSES